MKTLKFKSNINCEHCIKKVTNFINAIEHVISWEVDTESPDKILTILGKENIDADSIIEMIAEAGYSAELL